MKVAKLKVLASPGVEPICEVCGTCAPSERTEISKACVFWRAWKPK